MLSPQAPDGAKEELLNWINRANLARIKGISVLACRMRCPDAIREALEAPLGSVYWNQELFRESSKVPEVDSFSKLLRKVSHLVSVATKAKQLVEPMLDLLS